MTAKNKTSATAPAEESPEDLVEVIKQMSGAMDRLTKLGLNENAVIVLIKDDTGIPKKTIKTVLGSLAGLADKYTKAPE